MLFDLDVRACVVTESHVSGSCVGKSSSGGSSLLESPDNESADGGLSNNGSSQLVTVEHSSGLKLCIAR